MFNLNSVYACLHFSEETLDFLVVEYKYGIPYFLYAKSENWSNDEHWKDKVVNIVKTAEKKLGLKLVNLLLSINDRLDHVIRSKQIQLNNLIFTNKKEVFKKSNERLTKVITQEIDNDKKYWIPSVQLVKIADHKGGDVLISDLKIGSLVSLTWKIIYFDFPWIDQIVEILKQNGINILDITMASANSLALIEKKENESECGIIVLFGNHYSEIYVVNESRIVDWKNLDYCTDDMVTYLKNECASRNISFVSKEDIAKTIKPSIMLHQHPSPGVKLFCETNDQFLSFNYLETNDIFNLCQKYIIRAISSIDTFANEIKRKFSLQKIGIYFVSSEIIYHRLLTKVLNEMKVKDNRYCVLNFDLILNTEQKMIFPFAAILNLIIKQKKVNEYKYSIEPYFSEEYDLTATKKINRLKLKKKVNTLLQKIIK